MATSVPFDLDAASDLIDLSIQKIWIKSKADLKEYHRDFYYVEPVSDYIVKDSSVTSISSFSKIVENQAIPATSPYQGHSKAYTQGFFSGMLRITRPMWRYGIKARKLEAIVVELKKDAIRFKEAVLAGPINNMASTSYQDTNGKFAFTVVNAGGDDRSPKATNHTREDAGSDWSNVITDGTTSNMDFDYDALKAARRTAVAVKGGVGEQLDINIDKLVVKKESAAHHRAQEVLASIKKGEQPGTANREAPIPIAFEIVASPYFDTALYWGMFDSSMIGDKYGFQVKEGMPLALDPQFIDYDTKEIKNSAGMDFAFGFNDLRSWVFSSGANA